MTVNDKNEYYKKAIFEIEGLLDVEDYQLSEILYAVALMIDDRKQPLLATKVKAIVTELDAQML